MRTMWLHRDGRLMCSRLIVQSLSSLPDILIRQIVRNISISLSFSLSLSLSLSAFYCLSVYAAQSPAHMTSIVNHFDLRPFPTSTYAQYKGRPLENGDDYCARCIAILICMYYKQKQKASCHLKSYIPCVNA
jgi:hypothetical protein